jgi:uncharacterized protein (TIGR03435 family)
MALTCAAAFGQSFEVASVKPHPTSGDNRIRVMMGGGPGSNDPGRINYENVTVMNVLTQAFNVRDYQISGPSWIDSERYDITAKVPQGATKEEFRVMLQNLLKDRFGMAFHMDQKELSAYALVVAKGGHRLTKAAEAPADAPDPGAPPPPPPPPGRMGAGPKDKYGFPDAPPGRGGNMMIMMPGKAKVVSNNTTIARFAEMLSNQVGRPVVDKTELTGKYDITLYFEPEMRGMGGMPMPPPGMHDGAGGAPMPPPSDGEAAPTLVTALQEQLGLKLESRKESVDYVVIDKLDKNATDN